MGWLAVNRKQLFNILKTALKDWVKDKAVLRASSLTFFIILPLPTLLLIVIAVLAQFIGQSQATQILTEQITTLAGPAVAELFSDLISDAGVPFTSAWSAVLSIGFAIGGAIGAFSVLRDTMDRIWEVKNPDNLPFIKRVKKTTIPFLLVSLLGLFVAAWTAIASTIITALLLSAINGVILIVAINLAQILLSFAIVTLLLTVIYKVIPQATITWHDVALASIITGIIFTVTNYLFGVFIQVFTVTTIAGAAGSLLIILLWIFVLNQIVLFGAEFSKVYASTIGEQSKTQLPKSVDKAVEPIQKAGEKIEDAAKDDVVHTGKPRVKIIKINLKKGIASR